MHWWPRKTKRSVEALKKRWLYDIKALVSNSTGKVYMEKFRSDLCPIMNLYRRMMMIMMNSSEIRFVIYINLLVIFYFFHLFPCILSDDSTKSEKISVSHNYFFLQCYFRIFL